MHRFLTISAIFAVVVALTPAIAQQAGDSGPSPWRQWRGVGPWPIGPGMMGGGMMGASPRHPYAMMSGIPEAYRSLSNPLPRSEKTVQRGASVYQQNCASCHGATGEGDGPAGRDLRPPPANLAWLGQMPMAEWDPFMYWSVAEGGAPFGTAMPAFKDVLSKDDIWAVIAYIQAQLPQEAGRK